MDRYLEFRSLMNTGDLLLWASKSLLGVTIRTFSDSDVNHASVIVRLKGLQIDRLFNYESLTDGFGPHYLSKELEGYDGSAYWCRLKTGAGRAEIEERVFRYDGTPYDYASLFKMAIMAARKETSEMVCSEAAEVVVTGDESGVIHSPGELPGLGYWFEPIQIM